MLKRTLLWVAVVLAVAMAGSIRAGHVAAAALPCSAAAGHVTLLVEHGDGSVLQRCVGISGSSASGETVLAGSGVEYATVGYGGSLGDALCQVDAEPASYPPSCFQSNHPYWTIFIKQAGAGWRETASGISNVTLQNGDALGVRYETTAQAPVTPTLVCPEPTTAPAPSSASHPAPSSTFSTTAPSTRSNAAASSSVIAAAHSTLSAIPSATGAVLGTSTAHSASRSASSGTPWLGLLACLCGGGLGGLLMVRVVRR